MTADMPRAASSRRYTPTSRVLHWLTAILVAGMLIAGLLMTSIGQGLLQDTLYSAHKVTGITVAVLLAVRIAWRLTHPPPPLAPVAGRTIAWVARSNHIVLYILLVNQVVSGYVLTKAGGYPIPILDSVLPSLVSQSKPLSEQATVVHEIGQNLILLFVAVHIAGALYHLLVRKDGVFRRIWPVGEVR